MRIYTYILIFLLMLSCDTSNKFESPSKNYFLKYLGGDGDQWGVDFEVYSDGTYYVLGNSRATTNSDQQLYIAKVDAFGNLLWEKNLGSSSYDEQARDIEITSDGNLVIVANTGLTTNRDIYILTLSPDGNVIKSATLFISQDSDENVATITEISDGFIITGSKDVSSQSISTPVHQQDAFHLRVSKDLSIYPNVWRTTHGDGTINGGVKVFQVDAGKFYFFGYTNSPFNKVSDKAHISYWAFQLGTTGEASSNSLYPGDETYDEICRSVVKATDGYAMAGTAAAGTSNYIYLVKYNSVLSFNESDYQFKHLLSDNSSADLGVFSNSEYSRTVVNLASPSYFYVLSQQLTTDEQIYLIKVDNRGQYLWKEPILFNGAGDDFAGSVEEMPDGRIAVVGTMTLGGNAGQKKIVLMKLNPNGKLMD